METEKDNDEVALPVRSVAGGETSVDDASSPVSGTIAGIERTFLRLTFWQTILSVAGVFTGAVALYAALTESEAVRQQTAASVWPYVQFMIEDGGDTEAAYFKLSLENVGVGPARMRSMLLTYRGEAKVDWQTLVGALPVAEEGQAVLGTDYGKSDVSRRVLAPGDAIIAFQTQNPALALSMQEAVYSGAIELSYCYCSIFDECWQITSAKSAAKNPVKLSEQCPDYGAEQFDN